MIGGNLAISYIDPIYSLKRGEGGGGRGGWGCEAQSACDWIFSFYNVFIIKANASNLPDFFLKCIWYDIGISFHFSNNLNLLKFLVVTFTFLRPFD